MSSRFEVKEGIVLDNQTGLMWMQSPLERLFTWKEACEIKHSFGGFDDWRLPTIEELISIIDYSKRNPSIDEVFWFVDKKYFWSSSPKVGNANYAWFVSFNYGYVYDGNRSSAFPVRLVRVW